MNDIMKSLLTSAVKEFGMAQNICSLDEIQRKFERYTADGVGVIPNISDLRVRSVIMGLGTILKEDLTRHSYITTVKVGSNEALLVTLIDGDKVLLAACAHEGLFCQHLAKKAIELVQMRIGKLQG